MLPTTFLIVFSLTSLQCQQQYSDDPANLPNAHLVGHRQVL